MNSFMAFSSWMLIVLPVAVEKKVFEPINKLNLFNKLKKNAFGNVSADRLDGGLAPVLSLKKSFPEHNWHSSFTMEITGDSKSILINPLISKSNKDCYTMFKYRLNISLSLTLHYVLNMVLLVARKPADKALSQKTHILYCNRILKAILTSQKMANLGNAITANGSDIMPIGQYGTKKIIGPSFENQDSSNETILLLMDKLNTRTNLGDSPYQELSLSKFDSSAMMNSFVRNNYTYAGRQRAKQYLLQAILTRRRRDAVTNIIDKNILLFQRLKKESEPILESERVMRKNEPLRTFIQIKRAEWKRYQNGFPIRFSMHDLSKAMPRKISYLDSVTTLSEFLSILNHFCSQRKQPGENTRNDCFVERLNSFNKDDIEGLMQSSRQAYDDAWDAISIGAIFTRCSQPDITPDLKTKYCPAVCTTARCADLSHTSSNKCIPNPNRSLFDTDYSCDCMYSYYWELMTRRCSFENLCDKGPLRRRPCNMENTKSCKYLDSLQQYQCICADNSMGPRCQEIRNPCYEHPDAEIESGSRMCGIGGKCKPNLGTRVYQCECRPGYRHDPKYGEANCLQEVNACEGKVCNHGYCQTEENLGWKCVCDEDYYGAECSLRRPEWNQWGLWSQCLPVCGYTRSRQRTRTCSKIEASMTSVANSEMTVHAKSTSSSFAFCAHIANLMT